MLIKNSLYHKCFKLKCYHLLYLVIRVLYVYYYFKYKLIFNFLFDHK